MTDKEQIIIDGVDVSGCEYFRPNSTLTCSRGYGGFCDNKYSDKQCYFKQLARKTQECDNWKHQAELGSETKDRLSKQLEEKMQECEELKSESFTREELITLQEKDIDRYRNALEEIKEFCITYSDNHDCYEAVYKQILEFINTAKE